MCFTLSFYCPHHLLNSPLSSDQICLLPPSSPPLPDHLDQSGCWYWVFRRWPRPQWDGVFVWGGRGAAGGWADRRRSERRPGKEGPRMHCLNTCSAEAAPNSELHIQSENCHSENHQSENSQTRRFVTLAFVLNLFRLLHFLLLFLYLYFYFIILVLRLGTFFVYLNFLKIQL